MTTAVLNPPVGPLAVNQRRVIASEWTKFRSLRSTMWTLLIGIVLMLGLGALVTALQGSNYHSFSASDKASFSAIGSSLAGINFAQLAIGVLGVLVMSGEYSTGMIRSSLTVVPRRLPVLWAKLGVFAAVVFLLSLVASFASFLLGQSILGAHDLNVSLSSPGALRAVFGAAGYLTLAGMMGIAIGTLLRNTAAGISVFVAGFFVVPPLTQLLPTSVSNDITPYLPSSAGASLYDGTRRLTSALSPTAGLVVLLGYVVVLIAAAAWQLQRADA
jgi:ABC-type transport system involved in multi-copper enzyme maturation permease subunit